MDHRTVVYAHGIDGPERVYAFDNTGASGRSADRRRRFKPARATSDRR